MDNTLPAIRNAFLQERETYDLEQVVEWSEKGKRQQQGQHPPFNTGDLVRVKGFLEYRKGELNFHVDADGRVADNFFLVNPIDPEQARTYAGLPLESVVRVLNYREESFQISNIQNYTAGLIDITSLPLINPTSEEARTTSNTQAVICGEFVKFAETGADRFLQSLGYPYGTKITGEHTSSVKGYKKARLSLRLPTGEKTSVTVENPPKDYHDRETHAIIKTEDGREIEVSHPSGKIVYSGGNIENIKDKFPEEGDLLRISAKVHGGKFFAHWCDPCFLVDPSEERYTRVENLRLTLDANLDLTDEHIQSGKYSEARAVLAEVRAKEVTDAQLDRTYELFARIPKNEKPVLTNREEFTWSTNKNFLVESIDQAYEVRLEAMNKEEFTAFAKEALSGEIKAKIENPETSYLLRILPSLGFDAEYIENIAVHAIESRLERMKSRDEFADGYILEYAVNTVCSEKTPNAKKIVSDTFTKLETAGIRIPYAIERQQKELLTKGEK